MAARTGARARSLRATELARSIAGSWGRFLAIAGIVALGCGFYAGLNMCGADMRLDADAYYDGTALYDIRVVSTGGLSDAALDELHDVAGVEEVMPARSVDVMASVGSTQETFRLTTQDFNLARASTANAAGTRVSSDDAGYLNRLVLVEGSWPKAADECVVSADAASGEVLSVGDTVEVLYGSTDLAGMLTTREFKVVGLVRSPVYMCGTTLGYTTLGQGTIEQFAYVDEDAFSELVPYTEAYLTVAGARSELAGSASYQERVERVTARIEDSATQILVAGTTVSAGGSPLPAASEFAAAGVAPVGAAGAAASGRGAGGASGGGAGSGASSAGELYVFDRTDNPCLADYAADAARMDNIAAVFPFIFFLVAALVALTTMTRMVEDERIEIGTHKALGFSTREITAKYVLYALIASATGGIVGVAVLCQVLPRVIQRAYAIMYFVPIGGFPAPISLGITGVSLGAGIGVTLLTTWAAVRATLSEQPAALMLPRAPTAGGRILLERVKPLWRHLSFSWKVTLRNLFRYKRRMAMTLIGIAGCTALLLTGLGLHDSIWDIIDKQFEPPAPIQAYNTTIGLDTSADASELAAAEQVVASEARTPGFTSCDFENMQVASASHPATLNCAVVVPAERADFTHFVDLRTRSTGARIPLEADSVILDEKAATLLGLGVGDTIRVYTQDSAGNAAGAARELTITGVCENYVRHYLYLGEDAYRAAFGREARPNTLLAATDPAREQEISDVLHATGAVATVAFTTEVIDTYRTSLASVNMIVVVLVAAAAALAFIVLYNLTNINILERQREIASLKVLGFTPREVAQYVFREVAILVVLGAVLGLGLGVVLEHFVVVSSEVDVVMFGRDIHPASFIWALVATGGFSALVMLTMLPKLRRIDMVESLKSVD